MYSGDFIQIIVEQRMNDFLAEAEHMAIVKEAKRAKLEASGLDKPKAIRLPNFLLLLKNYFPVTKQS